LSSFESFHVLVWVELSLPESETVMVLVYVELSDESEVFPESLVELFDESLVFPESLVELFDESLVFPDWLVSTELSEESVVVELPESAVPVLVTDPEFVAWAMAAVARAALSTKAEAEARNLAVMGSPPEEA
jgi:hypothetical protein